MRCLALLVLFVLGAVAGMAAIPLLPRGARTWVSGVQQDIRQDVEGARQRQAERRAESESRQAERQEELESRQVERQTRLSTPTLRPTLTPCLTPTPRPTPTPTPPSGLPAEELDSLRYLALRLINNDRADHGLPAVVLGTNPAAQLHAEDMLVHDYYGHWWADGRKPYMVYTQTRGTSYASENIASSGWNDREWAASNCDSFQVNCAITSPSDLITEMQWAMMYDDAHADWGHRDNILGETHRAVNIGVAFNGRRTTFVQHFEGGAVEANGPPVLSASGRLSLEVAKRETGISVWEVVSVYYDPPHTPETLAQIDALDSYCTGGGFTTLCPRSIAQILVPAGAGFFYSNLHSNEVVANSWNETSAGFSFTADMGSLMRRSGVYTVLIFERDSEEVLVELSLFVESGQAEPVGGRAEATPNVPSPILPPLIVPPTVVPPTFESLIVVPTLPSPFQ